MYFIYGVDNVRALIFSDSHRSVAAMTKIIDREENIDYIIHAGDVFEDVRELKMIYPDKNIIYVIGNNDYFIKNEPYDRVFDLAGVRIFLTHGHNYGVKYDLYKLFSAAREKEAKLCIFGHTHSRFMEKEDGIWLFNPGRAANSCGLLEISDGEIKLSYIY